MTKMEKLAYSIQMQAFFDELHLMEKWGMLDGVQELVMEKEAMNIVTRALKGAKRLYTKGLGRGLQDITRAYQTGASRGAKMHLGTSADGVRVKSSVDPGVGAGLLNALRTPAGAALATGGAIGGVGLLGAGYLAGRGGGGSSRQNVYVR